MANIPNSVTLWQGDCLKLMKNIPDKSVDMVLCDLPYGKTQNSWDSVLPLSSLWEFYTRIVKETGAIVLFGQEPFSTCLRMSNLKMYRYDWIWDKVLASNFLNAKKMPLMSNELISVFSKSLLGTMNYYPQMVKGVFRTKGAGGNRKSENYGHYETLVTQNDDYYPKTILRFSNGNRNKGECYHPTQKPVSLCAYLIRTYTKIGETVLDNCMGSGSTGVACVQERRKFIGIEKEPKYFEVAKKRIADEAAIGRFDFGGESA